MTLAAHPALAAHAEAAPALGPHMTTVTAPAEAVAQAHSVAAVTAAPEAEACFIDPLGSSHIALSFFT